MQLVGQTKFSKIVSQEEQVHGCATLKDNDVISVADANVRTYLDVFRRGYSLSPNGYCIGNRPPKEIYKWLSYEEVYTVMQEVGSGLVASGLQPGNETMIGIYSQNRAEWLLLALSATSQSMVIVPLHHNMSEHGILYIVERCQLDTVFCDSDDKLLVLLRSGLRCLKRLIHLDRQPLNQEIVDRAEANHVELTPFNQLMVLGADEPAPFHEPSPDDLYMISFTSGSEGTPHGVQLTHENLVANVSAIATHLVSNGYGMRPHHTLFSYLPMAHVYEQVVNAYFLYCGARIGIFSGKISQLFEDAVILKPTVFPTVPRMLNKLVDQIKASVAETSWFRRLLFAVAVRSKILHLKTGLFPVAAVFDQFVFDRFHRILGDRVQLMSTGAAPISDETVLFAMAVFGCPVVQGYGMTEVTGAITMSSPRHLAIGHVGGPLANVLVKLVDVPELGYYSHTNTGEICVKGPSVTKGYYKDAAKTSELIDAQGWLHTGDVGRWLRDGNLQIIDRKKQIFKLAQGDYIAPAKIESVYQHCKCISEVFVDGNPTAYYTVAVAVPDFEVARRWVKERRLDCGMVELCQDDEFITYVLRQMHQVGKRHGLTSVEQVKYLALCPSSFALVDGLLTPTLKMRRKQMRQHFSAVLNELYARG